MAGFEELSSGTEPQVGSPGGAQETINDFENFLSLDEENNPKAEVGQDGKVAVEQPADGEQPERFDTAQDSQEEQPAVDAAEGEEQPEVTEPDVDDEQSEVEVFVLTDENGEELEVEVDELLGSYQRQSAFTKKEQALAEERREFEQHQQGVLQKRQAYGQLLGAMQQQLQAMQGQEPDWVELSKNDPVSYIQQKEAWDAQQRQMQAVQQEQARLDQLNQQNFEQMRAQRAADERAKLIQAMPALKDKGTAEQFRTNVMNYAESIGLTPQDISSLMDHRVFVVLDKARQFDEMQKTGKAVAKKAVKRRVPKVRPGSPKSKSRGKAGATRKAQERLAQTGDVRDAAKVFETLLS